MISFVNSSVKDYPYTDYSGAENIKDIKTEALSHLFDLTRL